MMRSIFLVPAGNAAALEQALASDAEAVAIDLVASGASQPAEMLAILRGGAKKALARIHPLTSGLADADLDAVMPHAPYGIILPHARGGRDVQHLGAKLAVREAENALEDGVTKILASAADLPEAIFELGSMARATRRLIGLLWDAAALAGSLGVTEESGVLDHARAQLIFAAAASGAPALIAETDANPEALALAARDGFSGALVVDSVQAQHAARLFS
jgi:citrate lyase subunit beta/citryl-CoA lyase